MATPLVHLNRDHFADPLTFNPERFIADPRPKKNLMSFSHGSRQCLGMQLAYAELCTYHGPPDSRVHNIL